MVPAPTHVRWNQHPHESALELEREMREQFRRRVSGLRNQSGFIEVVALKPVPDEELAIDHLRHLRQESVGVPSRDIPHHGMLIGCEHLSGESDGPTLIVTRVVSGDRRTLEVGLADLAGKVGARVMLIVSGASTAPSVVDSLRMAELQRLASLGIDVANTELGAYEVLAMTMITRDSATVETWITPRDRFAPERIEGLPGFVHQEVDANGQAVASQDSARLTVEA